LLPIALVGTTSSLPFVFLIQGVGVVFFFVGGGGGLVLVVVLVGFFSRGVEGICR
jgi:hypothetical protein